MVLKTYSFPFGDSFQEVALPEERVLQVITGNEVPPLQNAAGAALEAIRHPIGSKPLADVLKKGDKVAILVSDITRVWIRTAEFLPVIVAEANRAGIPDTDITIIVATGTHRANTAAENELVCGADICRRIAVVPHDARAADLVHVGDTARGTPVWVNRIAAEADKVILTGGITVHLFAGFGGGRKSIVPGVCGDKTILHNHAMSMADTVGDGLSSLTRTSLINGNRVHEDMDEACALVNPCFLVNSVMDNNGNFARIVAGHWREAWLEGCKEVMRIQGAKTRAQADVVIASGGGFPRDINLYQGTKAIDSAALALKPGGIAIVILECREMAQTAAFNSNFHFDDPLEMEKAVRLSPTIDFIIAFRVFELAKKHTFFLVTKPENFDFARKAGLVPCATVAEAWDLTQKELEQRGRHDWTINLMPYAATTVPITDAGIVKH